METSSRKTSHYQSEQKRSNPLSALLFIIVLDNSFKEVLHLAIINQNIQDEKKISPLPVLGFAEDIVLINYFEKVIKLILDKLVEKTKDTGLCIKPDKCAVLYEKRSAN